MSRLVTDWTCVATAGSTVDGREIKEEWLIDAAETYDTQTYTALIWPRHHGTMGEREYSYNLGTVEALKTEVVEGKRKLFAKLMPNAWLLESNAKGQKLFTSIELTTNFADTGRDYMTGICVTDTPASLGNDRLMFSAGGKEISITRGAPEKFDLGELMEEKPTKSLFQRIFSRDAQNKEDEMTKEELAALLDAQNKQAAAIAELAESVKAFTVKDAEQAQEAEPEAEPEDVQEENKDFSALIAAQKETQAALAEMAKTFAALQKTAVTQTPGFEPYAEAETFI